MDAFISALVLSPALTGSPKSEIGAPSECGFLRSVLFALFLVVLGTWRSWGAVRIASAVR